MVSVIIPDIIYGFYCMCLDSGLVASFTWQSRQNKTKDGGKMTGNMLN